MSRQGRLKIFSLTFPPLSHVFDCSVFLWVCCHVAHAAQFGRDSPGTAEPSEEGLGTNSQGEARPGRKEDMTAFVVMPVPLGDSNKGKWPVFQHQEHPISG